jgi:hypothetical protein
VAVDADAVPVGLHRVDLLARAPSVHVVHVGRGEGVEAVIDGLEDADVEERSPGVEHDFLAQKARELSALGFDVAHCPNLVMSLKKTRAIRARMQPSPIH